MKQTLYMVAILLLAASLISGCASTGVVPMDGDTYMISKRSLQLGCGRPVATQAAVYREANAFCAKQDKQVETVNLEVQDSLPARPGSVTLQFRCIDKK